MSQRALLIAVRDHLKDEVVGLGLAGTQCEVQFDGQPPPMCGELFVAVHASDWSCSENESLEEVYGVNVTVTIRVAKVPLDRMGPNALVGPAGKSLDDWLEKIRVSLHSNYDVMSRANTAITTAANGFVEPLRFRGAGRPEPKAPDWFSSEDSASVAVGLAQTLRFGDAKRVQTIESMT